MTRPEFVPADIRAMAAPKSGRATVAGSSAWRAGMITTKKQPPTKAVAATCHGSTSPEAINPARMIATRAVSPWATMRAMRRSRRSTSTPAGSESTSIGMPPKNEVIPSQVGEPVRS
jgi:hypothetical protein